MLRNIVFLSVMDKGLGIKTILGFQTGDEGYVGHSMSKKEKLTHFCMHGSPHQNKTHYENASE